MAKFKDLSSGEILEVKDVRRIEKLKGYPDKFQLVEEKTEVQKKETKKNEEIKKTK